MIITQADSNRKWYSVCTCIGEIIEWCIATFFLFLEATWVRGNVPARQKTSFKLVWLSKWIVSFSFHFLLRPQKIYMWTEKRKNIQAKRKKISFTCEGCYIFGFYIYIYTICGHHAYQCTIGTYTSYTLENIYLL